MSDDRDDVQDDVDGDEPTDDQATRVRDVLDELDADPRHLDPAGDLADALEAGEFDVEITDREQLEEFIRRAEAGEFGPADPGLEASVRIARALLEEGES